MTIAQYLEWEVVEPLKAVTCTKTGPLRRAQTGFHDVLNQGGVRLLFSPSQHGVAGDCVGNSYTTRRRRIL